ncbi:MAG: hypothetical protein ACRD45_11650, partial [Bryobacteraceae bacterium]
SKLERLRSALKSSQFCATMALVVLTGVEIAREFCPWLSGGLCDESKAPCPPSDASSSIAFANV